MDYARVSELFMIYGNVTNSIHLILRLNMASKRLFYHDHEFIRATSHIMHNFGRLVIGKNMRSQHVKVKLTRIR